MQSNQIKSNSRRWEVAGPSWATPSRPASSWGSGASSWDLRSSDVGSWCDPAAEATAMTVQAAPVLIPAAAAAEAAAPDTEGAAHLAGGGGSSSSGSSSRRSGQGRAAVASGRSLHCQHHEGPDRLHDPCSPRTRLVRHPPNSPLESSVKESRRV